MSAETVLWFKKLWTLQLDGRQTSAVCVALFVAVFVALAEWERRRENRC